jgi:hypothetical protein
VGVVGRYNRVGESSPALRRSDGRREPEDMKECEHLRGNAVDSAVDDADEGDREAARNLRNGKHNFFFLGVCYVNTATCSRPPVWVGGAGVGACVLFDVRLGPPGVRPGGVIRRWGPGNSQAAYSRYGRRAVSRRTSRAGGPRSPRLNELVGSAREAGEERSQLRGDTEDGTFDDAGDGGDEAHEITSLSAGAACRGSVRGRYCNLQQQAKTSKQLLELNTGSKITRNTLLH